MPGRRPGMSRKSFSISVTSSPPTRWPPCRGTWTTCRSFAGRGRKKAVTDALARLEKTANKWLKPYPNSALRENIEVALVAIAVAMAIRTFFLQPFKIPTGSMQPTLYGVTEEDLRGRTDVKPPGGLAGFF